MILPIHLLDTGDELEFGKEMVLLSKLNRLGFPVAEGLVIAPPTQLIWHLLINQEISSLHNFEAKQEYLTQFLLSQKPSLHTVEASDHVHLEQAWPDLVRRWMNETRSHLMRFGAPSKQHFHLKSLPIFFSTEPIASGIASFDPISKQILIKTTSGKIDLETVAYIDDLISKINKKLGIKYDFHFLVTEKGISLTRIKEAHHQILTQNPSIMVNQTLEKKKLKRSIKLYAPFRGNFIVDEHINSYYLDSEHFRSHDEKLMAVVESLLAKKDDLLYQISERFIKSDAAAIKFARNQKKLDHLQIVFPADQGEEKLLNLKRELAAQGVTRKGKMKFWLKVALPVSLLHVEKLLENGFDGVVVNIDFLSAALHARDITEMGSNEDLPGLFSFLEIHLKSLLKNKIPVVFYGNLCTEEEMIEKAVKWGVLGLVVPDNTEEIDQKIAFKEQVISLSF